MKLFQRTLALILLLLGILSSISAEASKPSSLRSNNKEGSLVLNKKAEEGGTDGANDHSNRQLVVKRGDPASSSAAAHHRPTKNSDATHHIPQAAAHSSLNPNKASQRTHHVATASAYATANKHSDPSKKMTNEQNQEAAEYHTGTSSIVTSSVLAAPRRRVDPGSCDGENDLLVEMLFVTDSYSDEENAVSLIKKSASNNPEHIWSYPMGSFLEFDSQDSRNPGGADYYFATCARKDSCYEFTFSDDYDDFDDEYAYLHLKVNGKVVMDIKRISADDSTIDYESDSTRPSRYVYQIGTCNTSGAEEGQKVFDYFAVTEEYVNSVAEAPRRVKADLEYDDQFNLVCRELGNILVEMRFWADEDSVYENEMSLVEDPRSDNPVRIWDYPIGSFKKYGPLKDPNTGFPTHSDYSIAICVPKFYCHEFTFLDVRGTFKDAKLDFKVDGCYIMLLTGDGENKIKQGLVGTQVSSVMPFKYKVDFGNCDR